MVRTTPFHPWPCELRPECLGAHWPGCFTVRNTVGVFPAVRTPAGDSNPAAPGSLVHRELVIDHRAARVPDLTAKLSLFDCGSGAHPGRPHRRLAGQRVLRVLRPGQHPQ